MKVLHPALLFPALLLGRALPAQAVDWQRIANIPSQTLQSEPLSATDRQNLEQAIVASNTVWDDCEDDNDWPHKIAVHRVNLGAGHYSLAEAGPGCARTSENANGAMWLLRWGAGKPLVIGDLDGTFHAALPQVSHGLHDVAVTWHNGPADFGLTLFRFNGTRYRLIDGTNVHCVDSHCTAVPDVQRPHRTGAVAAPTNESAQP